MSNISSGSGKLCKDCEYFRILYWPVKYVDFGKAECTKHNLVVDFANLRKFSTLKCVETENDDKERNDSHK